MIKKAIFILTTFILLSVNTNAKGVEAGTDITNIATLEYQIGGVSHSMSSNSVVDRVDQLIDVNIVWQDVSSVAVTSGDNNRILTYKITNTGNGKDTFALTYIHDSTSDFAINNPRIYADTNNNGIFDISIDQQVSQITLEADASSILFLISDIPTTIYSNCSKSKNILSATSNTGGSGTIGTMYTTAGINGVVAIDGMSGGKDRDTGIYEIKNLYAKLAISATTPAETFTSSIIKYTIIATLTGDGVLDSLVVADTIPVGTSYIANSLKLDGVSLSDAVDSDNGSFGSGEIKVDLRSATQTPTNIYSKSISFEVKVD